MWGEMFQNINNSYFLGTLFPYSCALCNFQGSHNRYTDRFMCNKVV